MVIYIYMVIYRCISIMPFQIYGSQWKSIHGLNVFAVAAEGGTRRRRFNAEMIVRSQAFRDGERSVRDYTKQGYIFWPARKILPPPL